MCGIVGYVGNNQATNILLNGLSKLEYRGYDSAGVAVYDNQINVVKVKGRLQGLRELTADVPAILEYTRDVVYIENLEIVKLTKDSCEFFNEDGESIQKEISRVEWDMEAAEKGGYEHFMLKEIHEQPKVFRDTISPRIKDGERIHCSIVDGDSFTVIWILCGSCKGLRCG